MSELDKFELIKNLAKLESQLAAMEFSAYGNIYPCNWLTAQSRRSNEEIGVDGQYCIGPAYSSTWPNTTSLSSGLSDSYAGPCGSFKSDSIG